MAKQTPNLNLYKVDPETDGDMSFNIETMLNENWDKVDEGFEQLQDNLSQQESDYVRKPGYSVTSGTGNAYIVTTDPAPAAYVDGMGIVIRANRANTGAATLNWNGLGAVPIVDAKGNPVTAGKIPNGARLTLRYSASTSNFQLQGEGGEYGTATQAEVMQGYTIGTEEGVLSGTLALTGNATQANVLSGKTYYATNPKIKLTGGMADYSGGGANQNPVKASTVYCYNNSNIWNGVNTLITVPPGYYANAHSIGAVIKNLSPENIKHGVNISDNQPTNSGCVGTFTSDGTILASDVLSGKKGYSKGVPITGTMPNRGAVTNTITAQGGQYTIPAGYHNGSGKITASFPNLIPGNVRQGVNIGGVVGSYETGAKYSNVRLLQHNDYEIKYQTDYKASETKIFTQNVRALRASSFQIKSKPIDGNNKDDFISAYVYIYIDNEMIISKEIDYYTSLGSIFIICSEAGCLLSYAMIDRGSASTFPGEVWRHEFISKLTNPYFTSMTFSFEGRWREAGYINCSNTYCEIVY